MQIKSIVLCSQGLGRIIYKIFLNRRVKPHIGRCARAIDGHHIPIVSSVRLPFTMSGITHLVDVIILNEVDTECILGADCVRTFSAILDPEANKLMLKGTDIEIPAVLSSMRAEKLMSLASVGIETVTKK